MKNILLGISLITALVLIGFSCKKSGSNNPLPPATQTGADKVGFYVNGKPWLPNVEPFGSIPGLDPVRALFWNTKDKLLLLFLRYKAPDRQSLDIYVKDFTGKGIYTMNSDPDITGIPSSYVESNSYFYFSDDKENQKYRTNKDYHGTLNITYYNSASRIVSGTFQFKAQNINGTSDSIIVTDGRFDCTMN